MKHFIPSNEQIDQALRFLFSFREDRMDCDLLFLYEEA